MCDTSVYSMFLMQSAKVDITKRNIDKIMTAITKRISMHVALQSEINKMVGSLEGMYLIWQDLSLESSYFKQMVKESMLDQIVKIYTLVHTTPRWCDLKS